MRDAREDSVGQNLLAVLSARNPTEDAAERKPDDAEDSACRQTAAVNVGCRIDIILVDVGTKNEVESRNLGKNLIAFRVVRKNVRIRRRLLQDIRRIFTHEADVPERLLYGAADPIVARRPARIRCRRATACCEANPERHEEGKISGHLTVRP